MSDFESFGNYGDGGFNQDHDSFQNDQPSSQKQQLRTSLTPVTIKQINESTQPIPDSEFQINGVVLNMVSFCGVIRKVENTSSAIVLTLEDGTGSIDIRRWIDANVTTADEEANIYLALQDKYVLVTGALKEFNQKKNIQNTTIREVKDHNELVYHNLSVIYTHIKAQGITRSSKNDLFVSEDGSQKPADTLKSLDDRVYETIASLSNSMPEGVPIVLISSKLSITDDVAAARCLALVESGRIYSAYDEHSFLSV